MTDDNQSFLIRVKHWKKAIEQKIDSEILKHDEDEDAHDELFAQKSTVTFSRTLNSGTKIGSITIDDTTTDLYCETDTDTTYENATTSKAGLMSQQDKVKLNGIADSADNVNIEQILTTGTKLGTISVNGVDTDLYCETNSDTIYTHPTYVDAPQSTNGLYKLKINNQGHVIESTPVEKADITALGIPAVNTTYGADRGISNVDGKFGHNNSSITAQTTNALKKIAYDVYGHITGSADITKKDITDLGIPAQDTTYSDATQSTHGLMSTSDKTKLDGITASADAVSFSRSLSSGTKIGTLTINGVGTDLYCETDTNTVYTHPTYTARTGKPTENQTPAFGSTVTVSQITSDGTGHVTGANDKTIKIPDAEASATTHGLMSATDKSKLNGIDAGANKYTHPTYTTRTGKPTDNQTPAFGGTATVSQIVSDGTGHVTAANDKTIKIPDTEATTSTKGLMTTDQVTKLNGIATGATKNTISNSLSDTSTTNALSAAQGKALNDEIAKIKNGTTDLSGVHNHDDKYLPLPQLINASSSNPKDLNDYTVAGFYYTNHDANIGQYVSNGPITRKGFWLLVEDWKDTNGYTNYTKQTITYYSDGTNYGRTFIRIREQGTWKSWREIAFVGDNQHTHNYISNSTGAVTSTHIADGTIVNGDIANTTITGGKLVNGTVTATQLASNAVETAKIKDANVTNAKLADQTNTITEYIVGTQTASTSAWTGKATKISSLAAGQVIYYKLPYASTSTAVTLNLTLADGTTTTGAKEVWFWNGGRMTTNYGVDSVIGLVYNGSQWWVINPSNNNNNYYLNSADYITTGEALTVNNLIACKKADKKYYKINTLKGAVVDISRPILITNGNINANTNSRATMVYNPWVSPTNLNGGTTLTLSSTIYQPVYLEGTGYSNGEFTVSTTPITQTLTNGRFYIMLGVAYATNGMGIDLTNQQVLCYYNGALIPSTSWTSLVNKPSSFTPSSHTHPDTQITWNGTNTTNSVSPIDAAMYEEFSPNRLAYLPGENITIEYSTNGGSTWTDYGATAQQKQNLVTLSEIFNNGKNSTTDYSKNQLRVTIDAGTIDSTHGAQIYMGTRKLMLYFCECNASGTKVKVEKAQYTSDTSFETIGTYDVKGWTGWNSIPINITFGGFANQGTSGQTKKLRLTFTQTGGTGNASIRKIRLFGETCWTAPSNLANNGHIYTYDIDKNVTFPAKIIKSDGTSAQFLKANGDIDSNVYIHTAGTGLTKSNNTLGITNGGVGATQLASNAVETAKIANDAVTIDKVKFTDDIGGTNLLPYTQQFNNATNGALTSDYYKGCRVRRYNNTSGSTYVDCSWSNMPETNEFKQGDKFTLSFWAKGTGQLICYSYGYSGYLGAKPIKSNGSNSSIYGDGNCTFTLSSTWKRFYVTWELNPSAADSALSVSKTLLIRTMKGADSYIAGVMFERGEIAHDWAPKTTTTIIPNGFNLNNATDTGFYAQPTSANTSTMTNLPNNTRLCFTMVVENFGDDGVTQALTFWKNSGAALKYVRTGSGSSWSNWTEVTKDTVYSHPTYTALSSGLYKITTNNLGHVSAGTAVTIDSSPANNANNLVSSQGVYNALAGKSDTHTHPYVPTANIKNDLTTGGTSNVLSAEQGKTLNNNKLDKTSYIDTFANLKTLMTNAASTTGGTIVLDRDYKAASGDGYFTLADNKILTIIGNGHTLDLNNITRFCNVNAGSTLNLVDFKIIRGNSTSYSGVIWNAGILKLENCVFADNTCVTSGGVMDMNGSAAVAIVSNCIFANNKATGGTAVGGVFALVAGSMFVTNSDFINNSSYDGGAITNKATMKIWNSNFAYNTASHYGGAINSTNANLAVYDTVFTNNTGGTSNSIYSASALTIYNCTLDSSSPTTNVTHRTYSLDNHTHSYAASSHTSVTANSSTLGHVKSGTAVGAADTAAGSAGTDNGLYARANHVHKQSDIYSPKSHAVNANTYGQASASVFGHAKAFNGTTTAIGTSANNGTDNGLYARGDHTHNITKATITGLGISASDHTHASGWKWYGNDGGSTSLASGGNSDILTPAMYNADLRLIRLIVEGTAGSANGGSKGGGTIPSGYRPSRRVSAIGRTEANIFVVVDTDGSVKVKNNSSQAGASFSCEMLYYY